MIAAEFGTIQRQLFGAYGMLADRPTQETWYSYLKHLDLQDVNEAVASWIASNSRRPTIADILEWADSYRGMRRRKDARDAAENVAHCEACGDTGMVITTYPSGIDVGAPCTKCPRGRERFPWTFLTPEAQEEWFKAQEKKGVRPCRHPLRAPDDYWMRALYTVPKVVEEPEAETNTTEGEDNDKV